MMRSRRCTSSLLAGCLAIGSCRPLAIPAERQLEEVAAQLRASKLPSSHARCPKHLDTLKGLSRSAIGARLGRPDFCHGPMGQACETSPAWAYLFIKESDRPPGFGGG